MQSDFPEFDALEDACERAAESDSYAKLQGVDLSVAALAEALVLANNNRLALATAREGLNNAPRNAVADH